MIPLLDILFPRRCAVCGQAVDRPARHLCTDCLGKFPLIDPHGCGRCGRPFTGGDGVLLCEECQGRQRPRFDRAASAFAFEGIARQLLLDYKSHAHFHLLEDFTDLLESVARARFNVARIDLVTPMPATALHRFLRGYNPTHDLARRLARRLGRRFDDTILKRTGTPRRQAGLSEEERRQNVIDTFAVRRPERVFRQNILVVDDVLTTGATLSECARTLKAAGAAHVWAVTLARTPSSGNVID